MTDSLKIQLDTRPETFDKVLENRISLFNKVIRKTLFNYSAGFLVSLIVIFLSTYLYDYHHNWMIFTVMLAYIPFKVLYAVSHLTAVLGPTLGTPGMLSEVSPISAR